jgi:hypothetical protein
MRISNYFLILGLVIMLQTGCGKISQPGKVEQTLINKIGKIDYSKLKAQVEEFNKATVNKDFGKVVAWMYPSYVEQLGGRENTLNVIKTGVEDYKAQGIEVTSIATGQPGEAVEVKNQLFSIVPNTSTLKAPGGKLRGEITVIAVSTDGTNWRFISGLNQERFNALFPEAAEQLIIPEISEPTFIESE